MKLKVFGTIAIILIFIGSLGCEKFLLDTRTEPIADLSLYPGGGTSVNDFSPTAFSQVNPALKGKDELDFFVGDSFFNQNWVAAPASAKARDGLGPLLNAKSCSGCHNKDGRGLPMLNSGDISKGFLMRISIPGENKKGGPKPHPQYGDQWQDQAIDGTQEGKINITYTYKTIYYDDGHSVQLRVPHYELVDQKGNIVNDVLTSPRVAQHIIGMGLIEAIDRTDIIANQTSEEAIEWGVSGKINWVFDEVSRQFDVGRYGWKAGQPTIAQQVAAAFKGDMGITSPIYKNDNQTESQKKNSHMPDGGTPEISAENFEKVVLYTSNLAVPQRRIEDRKTVQNGASVFRKIGCHSCHKPSYTTGRHPKFASLSNQEIFPYSDFLLHDMGEGLADDRPEFEANGKEWRTPPLWGIGLVQTVNNHTYYLHDGRARNIEEAIVWHGGEADYSVQLFKQLSKKERGALIQFVESL